MGDEKKERTLQIDNLTDSAEAVAIMPGSQERKAQLKETGGKREFPTKRSVLQISNTPSQLAS